MTKARILYLHIIIFFTVSSCILNNTKGCKKIYLSKEEKSWFSSFQIGERLLYKDQYGKIDTLLITGVGESFTTCNKFELGEYQYNKIGINMKPSNYHGVSNCSVNVVFSKHLQKSSSVPCDKAFYVFDLITNYSSDLNQIKIDTVKLSFFNKEVPTYLFEKGNNTSDLDEGQQIVTSFNWSKDYGLVRYTLFNGKVYNFWKKI